MSEETPEERQDNEFAALQAIYGDAVEDAREGMAWKVWRPLNLFLTLHPVHNSVNPAGPCSVTLQIKCPPNYPEKIPEISIHKLHGLSMENGRKLLSELESLAHELCGEVMIYQLATHVQQFLHDHYKPTVSFYDEMLNRMKEMEQLKLHDKQVKESEERKKIKDEVQKRQEILRCAGRQRVHRSSTSQDAGSSEGQGDAPELVFYADQRTSPAKKVVRTRTNVSCTCSSKSAFVVRVSQKNNRKIYVGNCLGHSSTGATTYFAIDDETGDRLVARKWLLPPTVDIQTRNRCLNNIQQDIKTMTRLKHNSIVPYITAETVKHNLYVFRDFILGCSLPFLRSKVFKPCDKFETLKLLRYVGAGVFSALKDLHELNLVHMDVRSENVFIDNVGAVKLVGATLDTTIAEMIDGESGSERQTKANDIYAAGVLLLSIISSEDSQDIPSDLPDSAKDFLSKCLTEDEHSQWSAEQLEGHAFLVDTPVELPDRKRERNGSESEDEDATKKIPLPSAHGLSRLIAEFEVLRFLGEGAFGSVLKVKNKLDGGFYAIKRVHLNPENVELNKKITREVKLLSRLNHENVVRYYNAWIETTSECPESNDLEKSSVQMLVKTPSVRMKQNSLEAIVAKLGPAQDIKVDWSIPEEPADNTLSSDSEEEDDDEQGPWFRPGEDDSIDIEFEAADNQSKTIPSEDAVEAPRPPSERLKQVLFIQMEFCEKHTLRHAIDNGLYQEHFRAWRLFREIVEGLAHVHQRGMIHRDLKPVNIFLDSNDHVKIGDFGLATKAFTGRLVDEKIKPEDISGSLTGQVGTALYVAPELLQSSAKVIYNQKVDIYSLGIILFEMFHAPLTTAMERMKILTDLRSKQVIFPGGFDTEENAKQIVVIKWLLSHDASLRPTCAELLASEHVPRPVPEGALAGLVSHTLSERGSRGYSRLMAACLDQRTPTAEDLTYHTGIKPRPHHILANIKDQVVKVFRSHGAIEFAPPLLIPRAKDWDQYLNAVKVMTTSGTVCHLPHDLRLPFARHIAYTNTRYMRRYVVDRVYREKHVQGFHPREMIECGFDIVTPKPDSLWTDAELLVVAHRAVSESTLSARIQMNHTELLRALLVCCGVPPDKHTDLFPVLADVGCGRITGLQLKTHLTSLCLSTSDAANLNRLLESEVQVSEIKDLVAPLVKQGKLSSIVTKAIRALEAVYRNAKALGCECPMTVSPCLAYNASQHSGVFWQMAVCREHKSNKLRSGDLIAAGGRYDSLVEEFAKVARADKDQDSSEPKFSSVGFSMSLERMAAILKKMDTGLPNTVQISEPPLICVCVWGTAGSNRDGIVATKRAQHARELWAAGYRCCTWPISGGDPHALGTAHEACRAPLVLQLDDTTVRVASWTHDRVREHKVPCVEVVDFIKQKFQPDSPRTTEASSNRAMSWSEPDKGGSTVNTSITFITAGDRVSKPTKRHVDTQISNHVTSALTRLGVQSASRCRVHVLALACEGACVRWLVANLNTPLTEHDLQRLPEPPVRFQKHQKIIDETVDELTNLAKLANQNRNTEETQLYALYSVPDSVCKLIT